MPRARIVRDVAGMFYGIAIECPGCGQGHLLPTRWSPDGTTPSPAVQGRAQWDFNGNLDRPTFSPSLLVRTGHHSPGRKGDCWCTWNAKHPGEPAPFVCGICHSFIRDGRIQFLNDCTHALAGQTVDLPELMESEGAGS